MPRRYGLGWHQMRPVDYGLRHAYRRRRAPRLLRLRPDDAARRLRDRRARAAAGRPLDRPDRGPHRRHDGPRHDGRRADAGDRAVGDPTRSPSSTWSSCPASASRRRPRCRTRSRSARSGDYAAGWRDGGADARRRLHRNVRARRGRRARRPRGDDDLVAGRRVPPPLPARRARHVAHGHPQRPGDDGGRRVRAHRPRDEPRLAREPAARRRGRALPAHRRAPGAQRPGGGRPPRDRRRPRHASSRTGCASTSTAT